MAKSETVKAETEKAVVSKSVKKKPTIQFLSLDLIFFEGDFEGKHYLLQARVEMSDEVVDDYANLLIDGNKLPAIKIIFDGINYYCWDGVHRYYAHQKVGYKEIECEISFGTLRDAWVLSRGANGGHGLRRDAATTRKVVRDILTDEEMIKRNLSDKEIADICKVSIAYVGVTRRRLAEEMQVLAASEKAKSNGVHVIKTAPLGKPLAPITLAPAPMDDSKATHGINDILDSYGNTIPNELRRLFRSDKVNIEEIVSKLIAINSDVNTLVLKMNGANYPETEILRAQAADIAQAFNALINLLAGKWAPHAICPYCKGDSENVEYCKGCKNKRWLNRAEYLSAPEAIRKNTTKV